MTAAETADDRERRLDEAVLDYLKAREDNPHLDRQAWIERNPEWKEELAAFYRDQDRVEKLATLLRLLTEPGETPADFGDTVGCEPAQRDESGSEGQGQRILGDYEILEEIGRGGMSKVYKARQRSLKRVVALKMILAGAHADAEDIQRFRNDAEAVAHLRHPNIVQIHETGELDGLPYFSLEFVEGGSLAAQLKGTPVPPRLAAELVRTLAEAIEFAHQKGVIHRDLKPANILLTSELLRPEKETKRAAAAPTVRRSPSVPAPPFPATNVKITDFGLAKRLDGDSGQTRTGSILGTPSYMAPEQARGDSKAVGRAADVYGLGAILYELLTGRPPFKAATTLETVRQVLDNEVVAPRLLNAALNRDLETICLACLQKDPRKRYSSAQELADDLRRFLENRPIKKRPISPAVKFWRLCRRHPGTSASLALALLTLVGLLVTAAVFNRRLKQELAHNEAINHDLQMSLTRQVADRIDSELRQLMRTPTLMATTLSQRSDWTTKQLEDWMRWMLENDERLFGTTVALEPRRFDGKQEDFALYAYRGKNGLQSKMLLLPEYKPHYREHRWYADTKNQGKASWSEPFFDEGGGDIPMITYSAPIQRDGRFAGVVTADLSVAYFENLRERLNEVNLGGNGYAFVISPSGTFISHPNPDYRMPRKITDVRAFQEEENLLSLTGRLQAQERGFVRAVDPHSGKASIFYFAPITSARWSFVAVIEE